MDTSLYSNSKTLEARNDFYKKLLFQSPDLIFQMTIPKSGIFFFPFLSKSVITHFNIKVEELSNDTFEVLKSKIVAEDFKSFLKSVNESNTNLKTWVHEFRAILPKKGVRWFKGVATIELDANGDINYFGKITDITEHKKQELKLKLSEQRFQFALEASSEGIWDYNVKANKVFFSSQSMKMLEFQEKDIIDTIEKWDDRVHPLDKDKYLNDIQMHIDNNTPYYENSQRVMTLSGEYKWILSRGKVIERDSNDKPLRIIGTHTDISAQKDKEKELVKSLEIIGEQNSRLLNFAHIVSHNMRSHAANIKMLLNIIDEEEDEESLKASQLHLRSTSDTLIETIDHLKELVEIQTELVHKRVKLNLNVYLRKTLDILGEEINRNKVIIHNSISNDEAITFNPAYLESILLNLISNAIKYSHPERVPTITFSLSSNGSQKTLSVSDNGLGIDLKLYGDKLFGMYKTFHYNKDSRGIGLFITKNQIEAMSGNIQVQSEVGKGTTFNIIFNEEV